MSTRTRISELLKENKRMDTCTVKGWVRTFRNNQFIALNDGSTVDNFQVVVDYNSLSEDVLSRITTGACLSATGSIIESQGKGQSVEMIADTIEILGDSSAQNYPLQPKRHSLEFLREIAHLRFRTQTFGSVFRVRHGLAFAIHQFFQDRGFYYLHTPIITASDAEGAGEMFRVTTLPALNPPMIDGIEVNYKEDFFGKMTNLTVSGQLEAEMGAMGLGQVYTFGPTFRAENSNTARHLSEFWMIEPEVAFNDLNDNMDLAESLLKYIIQYVLSNYGDDIQFLNDRFNQEEQQKPQNERMGMGLTEKLNFCLENSFHRLTYTEAIDILLASPLHKKNKFKYPIKWGVDLQSEHERYLVEKHFKSPVILTDYPAEIKAFYMRQNDDGKTVAAMDILFPGIGEMVGGSQREERLHMLEKKMTEAHIPLEEMSWYLDSRRFGTCPHAGFGLGFERMVQFVTGMSNIRDVIPFPRTPKNCEY